MALSLTQPVTKSVRPKAGNLAQDTQFANVVGVVVGCENQLASYGIAGGVGQFGREVSCRSIKQRYERCADKQDGRYALLPLGFCGQGLSRWPIAARPIQRGIVRIVDEVEDICLGNAQVLDEVPKAVRYVNRAIVDGFRWKGGYGVFEVHVGVVPGQ